MAAILVGFFGLVIVVNLSMANIDGRELLPFWSVLITALLVLADLHRRKEILLLNNLGLAIGPIVLVATTPGVLLELALATLR